MEQDKSQTVVDNSQFDNQQSLIKNTNTRSFFDNKYLIIVLVLCIFVVITILSLARYVTQNQTSPQPNVANPAVSQQSNQTRITQTQDQLVQISGSPKNTNLLPLGDGKYSLNGAKKGYIYLCNLQQGGGGAQETGNWIHDNMWNLGQKPSVHGSISWPTATFSNTISGSTSVISGNDLPVGVTTGIFPIQSTDPAYQYDRNPNTISAHQFSLTLPVNPTYNSSPSCIGGEVGIMLNGVPLFNGFDADHRDAAAHEIQDSCDGHPEKTGEYHYHSLSRCIQDIHETTVIGYALDGFPITGPQLINGNYLTTNDLDECHGITSEITLDGKKTTMYHYVMTEDFPYSVSCFRGKPVRMQIIPIQQEQQNTTVQGGQVGLQSGGTPQPPQEAFSVCSGKNIGTSCSFTAPRGNVVGICQMPPNQSSKVCVPKSSEQNQNQQLP